MYQSKYNLRRILEILNEGKILIFPTDTAYGIGCRIDHKKAVEKLFKIRKRPPNQAVPVLVSSIEMAQRYLLPLSSEVIQLMKKYWPGALTIVYPCLEKKVPALVRGGGLTLGVRIPDHKELVSLIKHLDCPLLGPSANFHGEKTPYKFLDLDPLLAEMVDYVIDDDSEVKGGISTILDCSMKPFKILRQGNIKLPSEYL